MADVVDFAAGSYRYLAAVLQYSAGVAAQAGFAIERVRFAPPAAAATKDSPRSKRSCIRASARRRLSAPASSAPRHRSASRASPSSTGSMSQTLERWGVFRDGVNPVARTNVCPVIDPPAMPSLHAFSYTLPARSDVRGTFVVAGCGETREGGASYRESIVALGDVSLDGLRDKVRYVVAEMERRLARARLRAGGCDARPTLHRARHRAAGGRRDPRPRCLARAGSRCIDCRPPVIDLEFEMDVRGLARRS